MGVVSTNTMVAGTNASGFVGFIRNQAGSMSPTTTDAFGVSPTIDYLLYEFFFMTIQFVGHLDNSSITGMTVTPAGGSTTTITFTSYVRDNNNNMTRFSDAVGTYPAFVSGTTYTVQLLGTTTDINTEGTTLERRNPKKMSDFYGATRNVPPVSGSFKLSWLKNAVKYQFSSAMTIAQYVYQQGGTSIATYTGYSTTILPAIGLSGTLGSMTDSSVDSIINFYNGATFTQILVTNPTGSQSHVLTINMTQTATNRNSEWYKVSFTPSGGSEVAFYREDLTYSRSGTTHSWVKTLGSTPLSAGSGTFKLTC
jgi:hypothetical protein